MIRLTMRELLAGLFFALLHGIWQECMQLNMLQEKKLELKGDGYQVQLGSYRLGSQDFRAFTFEL